MSAFLGPVHHWLFNKIVLFENLEESINNDAIANYGDEALKIAQATKEQYGEFIPKLPLENLIDTDNIHGWLQGKISVAEKRQSATLKGFIDSFGQDMIQLIEKNYIHQGTEVGKIAARDGDVSNAPAIHRQLNNYMLEGMPCDNVNSITVSESEFLEWNASSCLHKPYWDIVGANAEIMYKLRFAWIKAFVEGANNTFTYKSASTDEGFVHQIVENK